MDEFDLIRGSFGAPEADEGAIDRARVRLDDAIRAEKRARLRRRRVVLAAATVALGAAVAVVLTVVAPGGGPSAAAKELVRLARIAASRDAPRVGPGEYFLVVSEELRPEGRTDLGTGSSYTVLSRLHVKTWIGADGSSSRRIEVATSRFASEADRRAWEQAGRPAISRAGDVRRESTGAGEVFWVDLQQLPDDPAELLAALRSGSIVPRSPGDAEVFHLIGDLLAQGDAPSAVRASLLQAASRLTGVQDVGDVTDPLGREGVALAVDGAAVRTQLVFDPLTAHLLAIETYELGDGALRSWTAFHPAMVTGSAPF
jgi:hypothetical protein